MLELTQRSLLLNNAAVSMGLPGQNFELAGLLPVRGFGEVYLYADDIRGPEVLLNARSRVSHRPLRQMTDWRN